MAWFWLALAVALMVIELSTTDLVSVWFSLGAGVTALVKLIFTDIGVVWQFLIFVLISVALLLATRPLVKKLLSKKGDNKTNLDRLLGNEALVVENINNISGVGAVKINGLVWSARSENGEDISADTVVIFKEIRGNKAIVERKGE